MTASSSTYFKAAQSWALDAQVADARSRKIAWTVAGTAIAAALLEAVALACLAPLKTVQPVTLLVDRQTGFVQALDPVKPQKIAADDALTQSFLAQYVAAREGFDRSTVRIDYRKVALWSSGNARADYLRRMPATNPDSPMRRYPGGTVVSTEIKSVSRLGNNVSLVRFDTQIRGRDGIDAEPQPWIAVVRYRFIDAPMQMSDRLINPLGFQVTGYRRDAEPVPSRMHGSMNTSPMPLDQAQPPIAYVPSRPTPSMTQAAIPSVRRPRTSSVMPPQQGGPALAPRIAVENSQSFAPREVSLSQLPMGSPLSPGLPVSIDTSVHR